MEGCLKASWQLWRQWDGSLALTSPGNKKPCCEAQTLEIWFCVPQHRAHLATGMKIVRDGVLVWFMKKWKMWWFSCFLPLHVLFHSCSWLDLSGRGKRKKKKNPSYGHGFLFLCSIICICCPSSLEISLMQFFAIQRRVIKLRVTAVLPSPPRKRHVGLQMKGTLISPMNFQFSPKANLVVFSPAVWNDNEAIDRKQVQRGAARCTASLRTPLPRSASES